MERPDSAGLPSFTIAGGAIGVSPRVGRLFGGGIWTFAPGFRLLSASFGAVGAAGMLLPAPDPAAPPHIDQHHCSFDGDTGRH